MQTKTQLKIDWATHEAAKFACQNWHYSRCLPTGKMVKVGAWENDKYIGCVIFSYGANNNAPKSFGLVQHQICELTRIALSNHITPVSRIISIAVKFLKKYCPGILLVFSYADKTNQNHHGGIYQADNWLYLGERSTSDKGAYYIIKGKRMHGRSARAKYGKEVNFPNPWSHVPSQTKHLYIKIIDEKYVLKFPTKPYPKRASSKDSVASGFQSEEGGANPTDALQSIEVNDA